MVYLGLYYPKGAPCVLIPLTTIPSYFFKDVVPWTLLSKGYSLFFDSSDDHPFVFFQGWGVPWTLLSKECSLCFDSIDDHPFVFFQGCCALDSIIQRVLFVF
ncbi:Hypothetical predicted protein [Octopus vulgaris]|uniref:Uncharacterized protein n=1 Tax=Octopus vulgaris TaxID=6645 RepID=A0AA36FIW9_OCTVU|nr:Hypothetical predicted protein [Octopus vulgaris]